MKLQLLYQKVYFKSTEWKELVSLIHSIYSKTNIFLLSQNIFFNELKQIKSKFVGECVVVEIDFNQFNVLFDLINKIQNKYASKFFLIGLLYSLDQNTFFIKVNQLKHYESYFHFKSQNNNNVSLQSLLLFNFFKQLKLKEVSYALSLAFFKRNNLLTNNFFNYYY
jgi:hypothetical protein